MRLFLAISNIIASISHTPPFGCKPLKNRNGYGTTTYLSSMYLIVRYLRHLCKAPWINDSSSKATRRNDNFVQKKKKEKDIRFILLRARAELCENELRRDMFILARKLTRYLLNDANITGRLFLINKKIIANTCVR